MNIWPVNTPLWIQFGPPHVVLAALVHVSDKITNVIGSRTGMENSRRKKVHVRHPIPSNYTLHQTMPNFAATIRRSARSKQELPVRIPAAVIISRFTTLFLLQVRILEGKRNMQQLWRAQDEFAAPYQESFRSNSCRTKIYSFFI
jgi:hypothetical protein